MKMARTAAVTAGRRRACQPSALLLLVTLAAAVACAQGGRPQPIADGAQASGRAQPPPGWVCRRKQYPPRPDGRCAFLCPRNSCVKPGRACVDDLGDCACEAGYVLDAARRACLVDTSTCVRSAPGKKSPGCAFRCPPHSCVRPGHGCVDGIEDCACEPGYAMDAAGRHCVKADPPALEPPATSRQSPSPRQEEPAESLLSARAPALAPVLPPAGGSRGVVRVVPRHGEPVRQDLGRRADAGDEVMEQLGQLVALGVKLSVVLALGRGALAAWAASDDKLRARARSAWQRMWQQLRPGAAPAGGATPCPLSPRSKAAAPDSIESIHHVS
mmetsp:Transcript_17432/g.43830  ORF Transcript_17432/g.43830 Transcript_17432/m.43830 type:complete len:329 (+) Transcript_17432:243-1229(+)